MIQDGAVNMFVLSQKYPGLIAICPQCGALLAYTVEDIYENKYIYCPLCKEKIETKVVLE